MCYILYVKGLVEQLVDAPQEWVGKELDPVLVKDELVRQKVVEPKNHITIHLWRKLDDNQCIIQKDEQIFVCYSLRNVYGPQSNFQNSSAI